MRLTPTDLQLSATDLAAHLECGHRTQLEHRAARGELKVPMWRDPMADVLAQRGYEHEAGYIEHLKAAGREAVVLPDDVSGDAAREQTVAAMRAGAEVIVQASLQEGRWRGRADVLLRVELPSDLGDWSYEVVDTKLASETRGGTVLQLCLYSDLVRAIQGRLPAHMWVVSPGCYDAPECFRTSEFFAYYRLVRAQLEGAVGEAVRPEVYPEPVSHCDVCRWWSRCTKRRRDDDHLSLVAGASRLQRRELEERGVGTLTALAEVALPLDPRPKRGSAESYERIHHQARLQRDSRGLGAPVVELLPVEEGAGLARLPEPSPGDVFLDFEGDPFVADGGREYLFGWVTGESGEPVYHGTWALTELAERAAFEAFVDELIARWQKWPGMHVYHFAPYEPSAMKRMMGRHATRAEELDQLLRGERFVDLYAVVRQGMRVGVESYSIKNLEPLYGLSRETDLHEATQQLRCIERALELGDPDAIPDESRAAVESYNRDDCISALHLRDWLEARRAAVEADGTPVPRPRPKEVEPTPELDDAAKRRLELFNQLTEGLPEDPDEFTEEQRARWRLGHMLEFYRREDKAVWWEYFRLRDLPTEELLGEKAALVGLEFVGEVPGGTAKCPVHRYRFPHQEFEIRPGMDLATPGEDGEKVGEVWEIDRAARTLDVKKTQKARDLNPTEVFHHDHVRPDPKPAALERLAEWIIENGIDADGPHRAARDLLLARAPRLAAVAAEDGALERADETTVQAGRRLVHSLKGAVLPVQGPPGAGKTYLGARMILDLAAAGRRVGVTAVSHKVMRNLLDAVLDAAKEEDQQIQVGHKVGSPSDTTPDGLTEYKDNGKALAALARGDIQVLAGTAWLWSREDASDVLDVLVVDEAGQMSLVDTLAASSATENLVLLGDPQQLEQPMQGSHPDGTDLSALQHLLGDHETMPVEQGLFLAETWRLAPSICDFTSELFYEGRLTSRKGCERQRLIGGSFEGAGLWHVPVEHVGNPSSSPEEVERVKEIVAELTDGSVRWIHMKDGEAEVTLDDVLIVAPYNAQVARLELALPDGARVGTVDKFQGQEAPVVIYSMATSSPAEAPRGMEFLYDTHRLNVATSRARCACILVAAPALLEPSCNTPRQMRLANALCGYAERARIAI